MLNKKYHNLAAGWINIKEDGSQSVSFMSSSDRDKVKLLAQLEDGSTVTVTRFFMQENRFKKEDRHPDYKLVMVTEE